MKNFGVDEMNLIEVEIEEGVNEKIIIESLSRIGVGDKKNKILYPSCYYYKKDGRNYIAHFKEILVDRDGGFNNISEQDYLRRNAIINCLYEWELINVDTNLIEPYDTFVFILPHKEKKDWKIVNKIRMDYKNTNG